MQSGIWQFSWLYIVNMYLHAKNYLNILSGLKVIENFSNSMVIIEHCSQVLLSDDFLYENTPIQIYWKFCNQKKERFQIKKKSWYFFYISAQNIDCGYSLEPPRRGGSNEYPQSMFWAEIRKIMYTPVNPGFIILKWGLRGSKLYRHVYVMSAGRAIRILGHAGTINLFQTF